MARKRHGLARHSVLLFVLLLLPLSVCAQEALKFLDKADGKPVSGTVVTVYSSDSVRKAFGFADKAGVVKLKAEALKGAAFFIARKMNYAPLRRSFPLSETTFYLTPEETELPEVTITRKPIRMEGDTVVYDAGAFLQKKDAVLGDLLGHLPGIKVEANGSVKYQGEPIKKMYIEGMDLLGGRYNTATKNLSSDAVSRVEVLENHQDIKMLRGIVPEEKASLNIRIKEKYKSRPFGYLEGGLDHRAEAFAGHLNATQISGDKVQYIADLKGNSSGELYEQESVPITAVGDFLSSSSSPDFIRSLSLPGAIPIDEEHYLRNAGGLLSGTALINAGEDRSFRLNMTAFGEMSRLTSDRRETYTSLTEPVEIREETSARKRMWSLSPTMTWTTNAKGMYLEDKLSYQAKWGDLSNRVIMSGETGSPSEILAEPKERLQYLTNTLYGVIPAGKLILTANSFLRGTDQESRLIPFVAGSSGESQILKKQELLSKQSLSFNLNLAVGLRFSNGFRYDFTGGRYTTGTLSVTSLRHLAEYTPALSYSLPGQKLHLSLTLPLSYTYHTLLTVPVEKSLGLFALNPSFSLSWAINPQHRLTLRTGFRKSEDGGRNYFPGKLYLTHREATEDPLLLTSSQSWSNNLGWQFKDLYHYLFASLSLSYSRSQNALTQSLQVTPERTTVTFLSEPSPSEVLLVTGDLSKTFADVDLDFKLSALHSRFSQSYLFNDLLQKSLSASTSLTLSASWSPLRSLTFDESIGLSFSSLTAGSGGTSDVQTSVCTNTLEVSYTPIDLLTLSGVYDLTAFPGNAGYRPSHLLGANAKWTVTKDLSLSLSAQNILGVEGFREERLGKYSEVLTFTPLIPFRLMLSCKWSFR